jgi:hypothetical protein
MEEAEEAVCSTTLLAASSCHFFHPENGSDMLLRRYIRHYQLQQKYNRGPTTRRHILNQKSVLHSELQYQYSLNTLKPSAYLCTTRFSIWQFSILTIEAICVFRLVLTNSIDRLGFVTEAE